MRRLVWAADARRELSGIFEYVASRDRPAAERLRDMIRDTAEKLPWMPFIYRAGRVTDTREALAHPNYIIVYRVYEDRVRILRVLHARRRYP